MGDGKTYAKHVLVPIFSEFFELHDDAGSCLQEYVQGNESDAIDNSGNQHQNCQSCSQKYSSLKAFYIKNIVKGSVSKDDICRHIKGKVRIYNKQECNGYK